MTHFVGLVVCDSEQELDEILDRYDENQEVDEYYEPLSEEDIKSFLKFYSDAGEFEKNQKFTVELYNKYRENWNESNWIYKDTRWYRKSTYNKDSKWDWWKLGGRWNGIVPNNQCLGKDIEKYFIEYFPSIIVTKNGWYSTKDYGWFGGYVEEWNHHIVKQILQQNLNKNMFVVDFHI